ncbi:hypothetical protein DERP_013467 [Dermatophagoides pteronyssinus]|uniref:Uncharacterized protein n=1 Tax=Dermatophagoides pteronyssinus TaxID=6956 RepID=A0ABQ8JSA2_DERPT|nr:hypothetical protein DERP_013467 [Dermatophagoides pteronyssinus]
MQNMIIMTTFIVVSQANWPSLSSSSMNFEKNLQFIQTMMMVARKKLNVSIFGPKNTTPAYAALFYE